MSSSTLQDLRRAIYVRAKADPSWRFWSLWVHICKEETLASAYQLAKRTTGLRAVTESVSPPLNKVGWTSSSRSYGPSWSPGAIGRNRPTRGDPERRRQNAPAVDSHDSRPGGPGSREAHPGTDLGRLPTGVVWVPPKRKAHAAVDRVATAIAWHKTRVVDLDLRAFFDTVQHDLLLQKVAKRVGTGTCCTCCGRCSKRPENEACPKAGSSRLAQQPLPQRGGPDARASQARDSRRVDECRGICAVCGRPGVLVHEGRRWDWVLRAVQRRLREELANSGWR